MTRLTQELIEILTLEKLDENRYLGQSRDFIGKRVFGGQILGQALRAASYTTDRPAHSLHGYFLRGGDINEPITYEVERLRDGQSFVSRQVRAIQYGRTIFTALISFASIEEGLEYQKKQPDYPHPDTLQGEQEIKESMMRFIPEPLKPSFIRERHIELKPLSDVRNFFKPKPAEPLYAHYVKTHDSLKGEQDQVALHQAIVAFYSDFVLMTTALRPHGLSYLSPNIQCASIDHAIYFHKPMRADEWVLYDMEATVTGNARGMNYGYMWQDGELVCSTVQEGLMRMRES
ncbi:acyl-CoA thioesterase [Acinetobacter boissieri]|uniref:Acyl-CoA thioesterase 2 n=1 Tax=Acinetobacter boissieri TaxID=1219383 RepID=A0A1G6JZN8_9GAMM|nr:acyl-CoA thioesterase II [Acinetobacter boissieri]SDC24184.1 acyl-CoA thioesterase-2 [Acinetobacter boissieri]